MALIKCTECGKMFSDKAICCPECGCPTEIVLKDSNPVKTAKDKEQSSKQATASILEEVERTRNKAKSAEGLFDSRNRSIQMKASRSIEVFGGDATSRVVEIRADARAACDDLYTTYQTLVETLDGMCRPLLVFNPSGEAIKAVSDLIRHLNEESEIDSNFTASFNGSDLGNVANSKYVPSISNKMIQKFWETKYASSPYAVKYEKKCKKEAEEAQKRRAAEHVRAEVEKKQQEEQQKIDKQKAKAHMDTIVSEADAMVAEYEKQLKSEAEQQIHILQLQIEEKIQSLKEQKSRCEHQLTILGLFCFSEKKKLTQEFLVLDSQINKLSDQKLIVIETEKMYLIVSNAVRLYRQEIQTYLSMRFPYGLKQTSSKKAMGMSNEYIEDSTYTDKAIPAIPNAKLPFEQSM